MDGVVTLEKIADTSISENRREIGRYWSCEAV